MSKVIAISNQKGGTGKTTTAVNLGMEALVESIKQCGVLTPVIARPHKDGGYEILSGHRRVKACELAGITDIPVVIKNLDDDTATILLVDSNLQREHILMMLKLIFVFVLGLITGGLFGVGAMCCFISAGRADKKETE